MLRLAIAIAIMASFDDVVYTVVKRLSDGMEWISSVIKTSWSPCPMLMQQLRLGAIGTAQRPIVVRQSASKFHHLRYAAESKKPYVLIFNCLRNNTYSKSSGLVFSLAWYLCF